jgi:hypothetical protein
MTAPTFETIKLDIADGVAVHGDGTQICHLRRHRHEFWRQHR